MYSKKDNKECVNVFAALDLKLRAAVASPISPTT